MTAATLSPTEQLALSQARAVMWFARNADMFVAFPVSINSGRVSVIGARGSRETAALFAWLEPEYGETWESPVDALGWSRTWVLYTAVVDGVHIRIDVPA